MASLPLQAELGFWRLPAFCGRESPLPQLSYPSQAGIGTHHRHCGLMAKSLHGPTLRWPSTRFHNVLRFRNGWGGEVCCLPSLASSPYSKGRSQLENPRLGGVCSSAFPYLPTLPIKSPLWGTPDGKQEKSSAITINPIHHWEPFTQPPSKEQDWTV